MSGTAQDTISMVINGATVEGKQGDTVLQVARRNDIYIPTLCHMDHLAPTGSCRICLVELENGDLTTACTHPAGEGMKVVTENEKIRKYRKTTLELILSNNMVDCLNCEKRGSCELAKLCYEYDVQQDEYSGERKIFPRMTDNPFFGLTLVLKPLP